MNEILKQRLLGALILIALGIVFWPIIFVEPVSQPLGEAAQIPVRPTIDTTPIDPPGREGLRASLPLKASKQAKAEAALTTEPDISVNANAVAKLPAPQKPVVGSKPAPKKPPMTRSKSPAKPVIDADGIPIAWILQVASVSSPSKAEELRSGLIGMGYKAYIKKIKRENSVLLRVYVGPKFERARLEAIQQTVDTQFNVESMVRRYIP